MNILYKENSSRFEDWNKDLKLKITQYKRRRTMFKWFYLQIAEQRQMTGNSGSCAIDLLKFLLKNK